VCLPASSRWVYMQMNRPALPPHSSTPFSHLPANSSFPCLPLCPQVNGNPLLVIPASLPSHSSSSEARRLTVAVDTATRQLLGRSKALQGRLWLSILGSFQTDPSRQGRLSLYLILSLSPFSFFSFSIFKPDPLTSFLSPFPLPVAGV
jgi:hypothetical protein